MGGRKGEDREGTKEWRQEGEAEGLHGKFHVNVFIVSASGAKNNLGQFLTFGGHLYRPSFTNEGQILCARADPRSTLTRQIS